MESKAIRLSTYVLDEINQVAQDVDAQTQDAACRHLISEYKRLKSATAPIIPETMYRDQKEREGSELIKTHQIKCVDIVGQAKYNMSLGYNIDTQFAELVKEVSILSNLSLWSSYRYTEGSEKDSTDLSNNKAKRFIEIMECNPENITPEMKIEVINLFHAAYCVFSEV